MLELLGSTAAIVYFAPPDQPSLPFQRKGEQKHMEAVL
jgi:hypothetical protein